MSPCGSEQQTDGDMGLQRGGGVERSTYTSHAWVALSKTFHPHSPDFFRDHFLSAKDNNGSSKDPARVPLTQFGGGGAETTPKNLNRFPEFLALSTRTQTQTRPAMALGPQIKLKKPGDNII